MTNNTSTNDHYSKNEWWLDATTFFTASALVCASKNIMLLDPAAIGLMLSAGANSVAIPAANAFAQKYGINSRLIKVCALITALAFGTFTLPWLVSIASAQTFAILSLETAIESTLIHLALKTTTYAAFRTGQYIKGALTTNPLPTSVQNVQKMSLSELQRVRAELDKYPTKTKYLPLDVQLELQRRFKEINQDLALTDFSELGNLPSDKLNTLHQQDTSALPLDKKTEVNKAFFKHNLPPQENRPYEYGEVDRIDLEVDVENATTTQLGWINTQWRLNPNSEIPSNLPPLWYKHQLPPVQSEWIPLKAPAAEKAVTDFADYEISWYQNFYAANKKEWNALPLEVQTAFNKRFSEKLTPYSPPQLPTNWQVTKNFPWKPAVGVLAFSVLGIATYNYLQNNPKDLMPVADTLRDHGRYFFDRSRLPSLNKIVQGSASIVKNSTWSVCSLNERTLWETAGTCVNESLAQVVKSTALVPTSNQILNYGREWLNLSSIKQVFQTHASQALPIVKNTVSICSPIYEPFRKAVQETINVASNVSNTDPFVPNSLLPSGAVVLTTVAVGAVALAVYALKRSGRNSDETSINTNQIHTTPLNDKSDNVKTLSRVRKPSGNHSNDDTPLLDAVITNNTAEVEKRERFELLQQKVTPLLDAVITNNTKKVKEVQKKERFERLKEEVTPLLNTVITKQAEEVSKIQNISNETQPKTLSQDKFLAYCDNFDVEYDRENGYQNLWLEVLHGFNLLKNVCNGQVINPTIDNIRHICWAQMIHGDQKTDKSQGFQDGTFVVNDPDYLIYNTFRGCEEQYGRASSHFSKIAIADTDGEWKNYSHFGIDIPNLPPNMRTVLFGKIQSLHNQDRFYIKFEDWGADLNITSVGKAQHFACHSFGFACSLYRKMMGTNSPPKSRKEHLEDTAVLQKFIDQVYPLIVKEGEKLPEKDQWAIELPNLKTWGYIEAVPYLVNATKHENIATDLRQEIIEYIADLDAKFGDGIFTQHGNSVQIGHSIADWGIPDDIYEINEDWEAITFEKSPQRKETNKTAIQIQTVIPRSQSTTPLDRDKFNAYLKQHSIKLKRQKDWSWQTANCGIALMQQIFSGEPQNPQNLIKGEVPNLEGILSGEDNNMIDLRTICWGLMAFAIETERGFQDGMFIVKDPDQRLFKILTSRFILTSLFNNLPTVESSEQFSNRIVEQDTLAGRGSHFRIAVDAPPAMNSIRTGVIEMINGELATYVKFENTGLLENATAVLNYFTSTPQDDPNARNPEIPEGDKEWITEVCTLVKEELPDLKQPEIEKWGFAAVDAYLQAASRKTEGELQDKILDALTELTGRYGFEDISTQTGNEVQIRESFMDIEPSKPSSQNANFFNGQFNR